MTSPAPGTEDGADGKTAAAGRGAGNLLEVLALEQIEDDLFRANFVAGEDRPLYGGQVAAQALAAAGATVPADRLPHSLHGYFLRAGDSHRPTVFRVERDRDGRSFSARRVIAIQHGEVIFNMAASFHVERTGPEVQITTMPDVAGPDDLPLHTLSRQPALEARDAAIPAGQTISPRFWARCRHPLPDDPLVHACVLTYLSDASMGFGEYVADGFGPAASIDHSLWLHRPVRLDEWVLVDLGGHVAGRSRGLYTGSFFTADGTLAATVSQEMLFRPNPS